MGVNVHLIDGFGNKVPVHISPLGELITAPFDYDLTSFKEIEAINQAFNFYAPLKNKQFVMTGVIAVADISGNTSGLVVFYEAESATEIDPTKIIYEDSLAKGERTVLLRLNILTSPGVFINAKTTEATINVTILGYFIPQI